MIFHTLFWLWIFLICRKKKNKMSKDSVASFEISKEHAYFINHFKQEVDQLYEIHGFEHAMKRINVARKQINEMITLTHYQLKKLEKFMIDLESVKNDNIEMVHDTTIVILDAYAYFRKYLRDDAIRIETLYEIYGLECALTAIATFRKEFDQGMKFTHERIRDIERFVIVLDVQRKENNIVNTSNMSEPK